MSRATVTLGKILGSPDEVTDLPSKDGEVTPMMKKLINAYFEGTVRYVKEQTNEKNGQVYEARWEVGRVFGPADANTVVDTDWSEFFK
jgi:hypothetical protein